MSDLKWEAPNKSYRKPVKDRKWDAVANALREHPGDWAVVREFDQGMQSAAFANHIRVAKALKSFEPPGSFEATSQQTEPGHWKVYARFIGSDRTESPEE